MAAMGRLDDAVRTDLKSSWRRGGPARAGDAVPDAGACGTTAVRGGRRQGRARPSRGRRAACCTTRTVRTLALKRTQKLGIALTVVIAAGLAASLWFWRDADAQRVFAEKAATSEKEARELANTRAEQAC